MYNRSTGIYEFENNTYPRRKRHRSNLGHIFREKRASYGPGSMVPYIFIAISDCSVLKCLQLVWHHYINDLSPFTNIVLCTTVLVNCFMFKIDP